MPTTKVKTKDEAGVEREVEIDLATVPDQVIVDHMKTKGAAYLPTAAFEAELNRRGIGIAKGLGYRRPEELEDDPDHVAKVIAKHAPNAGANEAARAKELTDRVNTERAGWTERELEPLKKAAKDEKDKADATIATLTTRGMHKEIIAAYASVGAKQALLKGEDPKSLAPIVALRAGRYGYDPRTENFYVRNPAGDGFVISSKATEQAPYVTIQEDAEQWAGNKNNAEFIQQGRQTGAGLGATAAGGAGDGTITLTPEQHGNPAEYERALKAVGGDYSKIRVAPQPNPYGI